MASYLSFRLRAPKLAGPYLAHRVRCQSQKLPLNCIGAAEMLLAVDERLVVVAAGRLGDTIVAMGDRHRTRTVGGPHPGPRQVWRFGG
jgi:hypothetical protein